jgi:hypothetical protein
MGIGFQIVQWAGHATGPLLKDMGANHGDGYVTMAREGLHRKRVGATHLMDVGVDIHVINHMMGYSAIRIPSGYLHNRRQKIANVISAMDPAADERPCNAAF